MLGLYVKKSFAYCLPKTTIAIEAVQVNYGKGSG